MQTLTSDLKRAVFGYVTDRFQAGEALDAKQMRLLFAQHREHIEARLLAGTTPKIQQGFDSYSQDSQSPTTFFVGEPLKRRFVKRCVKPALERYFTTDVDKLVDNLCTRTEDHMIRVAAFFRAWEGSWDVTLSRLDHVGERWGYWTAASIDDSHQVAWQVTDACPRCAELHNKVITPRTVNYHGLGDRDCQLGLQLVDQNRLPARVPLLVKSYDSGEDGQGKLELSVPSREDYLDMSVPNRFLKILLDSQESAVLPEDAAGGWEYSGSGIVRLPKFESGVAELWSDDRVVARVRFEALERGA